jgi:hypothetical protein
MDRREFIAAAGTVAAVASTSQAFAQMAAEEQRCLRHSRTRKKLA